MSPTVDGSIIRLILFLTITEHKNLTLQKNFFVFYLKQDHKSRLYVTSFLHNLYAQSCGGMYQIKDSE